MRTTTNWRTTVHKQSAQPSAQPPRTTCALNPRTTAVQGFVFNTKQYIGLFKGLLTESDVENLEVLPPEANITEPVVETDSFPGKAASAEHTSIH